MFEFLFGWRKASKCKKLIKRARCRLKLLKIKRCSIVRHLREDMACLITNGYEQTAFDRVEQLIKDESTMAVYELLDNFCEFILTNLSYIRRHKDVPNDINEAVSSLIFASPRCGDLPELQFIRKLFGERYGQKFVMAAVELCPGNLVNDLIKEKLCIKSVPEDAKRRFVDEITKDCIKTEVLALEYNPEWHQKQVKEKEEPETCYAITYEPPSQDLNISIGVSIDSSKLVMESQVKEKEEPETCYAITYEPPSQDLNISIGLSLESSKLAIVPYESTDCPNADIDSKAHLLSNSPTRLIVSSSVDSNGRTSSSESLPEFSMDTIVYLDDIVELRSPAAKEENLQDQRVFKFKSNMASKKYSFKQSFEKEEEDEVESWSEKLRSKNLRISGNGSGKRTRVRSASKESINMKDSDCISYYSPSLKTNAAKKQKSHYHLQHLKKLMAEEDERKSSMEVRSNILSCKCHYNPDSHERDDCSLEYPCYFCTNGDKDDCEITPWKQKIGIVTPRYDGFPIEPRRRSSKNRRKTGHISGNADNQFSGKQKKEKEGKLKNPDEEEDCLQGLSLIIQNRELSCYSRVATMPPERSKDPHKDMIWRSHSCPNKQPNHVHPKLPDYDDIAAKFKALKREHLEKTLAPPTKAVQNQSL